MELPEILIVEDESIEALDLSNILLKPNAERELYTSIETSLYTHRVDSRMRESEARYRALFEGSRDAIFMLGADGMIPEFTHYVISNNLLE